MRSCPYWKSEPADTVELSRLAVACGVFPLYEVFNGRRYRINARAAVILGETEIAAGVAQLRDLDAGTQESVAFADIPARLQ